MAELPGPGLGRAGARSEALARLSSLLLEGLGLLSFKVKTRMNVSKEREAGEEGS